MSPCHAVSESTTSGHCDDPRPGASSLRHLLGTYTPGAEGLPRPSEGTQPRGSTGSRVG